jgi:hypothetical protein
MKPSDPAAPAAALRKYLNVFGPLTYLQSS